MFLMIVLNHKRIHSLEGISFVVFLLKSLNVSFVQVLHNVIIALSVAWDKICSKLWWEAQEHLQSIRTVRRIAIVMNGIYEKNIPWWIKSIIRNHVVIKLNCSTQIVSAPTQKAYEVKEFTSQL